MKTIKELAKEVKSPLDDEEEPIVLGHLTLERIIARAYYDAQGHNLERDIEAKDYAASFINTILDEMP